MLCQSYRNIEFIIYDDGSSKEVKNQLHELSLTDKRILLIDSSENHGLGYALNRCIECASGVYIARMDGDDESLERRIEKQVNWLNENSEYDWVGTNALVYDDMGVWGNSTRPRIPLVRDYKRYSPYIHPSVMFRREVLTCNHYDEGRDTRRCEDLELFMRLTAKGMKGYNIQEELFKYRVDRTALHSRPMNERISECKVRYAGYKRLGINRLEARVYSLRPVVSGILPTHFISQIKKKQKAI